MDKDFTKDVFQRGESFARFLLARPGNWSRDCSELRQVRPWAAKLASLEHKSPVRARDLSANWTSVSTNPLVQGAVRLRLI